ncbi:MAG: leader peptidase (prepilin peptidase) / N-methyltransferase [Actinomycetota bacterium]|jgi:leader peptidase (prepilin peptidase)/N-methyltransferase|nr:leader peptidase (prepilin peptidase) / N-methyltransferase [Actinomycetota bacterium]
MGALGWAGCLAVIGWAAALCVKDIRELRLPNALTLGGAVAILGVAVCCGQGLPALCGALALGLLYLLVHLAAPAGLGAGDVKLALGVGALTGALGAGVWALAALAAPMATAVLGLTAAACGRRGPIPHGPSMLAATVGAAALAMF